MLNTAHLISDTQLSNEDASQLILATAIDQLSSITGLDTQECLSLLSNSASEHTLSRRHKNTMVQNNIIDQNESDFIGTLFCD